MPKRIQRKRTKGWKMPENAVYVGRPTKWGNPWKVGDMSPHNYRIRIDAEHAVQLYRQRVDDHPDKAEIARELRGKDLACWCPLDQPCHADVLLEVANA